MELEITFCIYVLFTAELETDVSLFYRFVYESNCDDKLPEGTVMWDCPYLWKDRKYVDINQLKQKLEILYTHTTGILFSLFCLISYMSK